ncbi:MAG: M23 family metallopeptidase [Candidatus Stygibacter australis]|nr:M23 family metallopeptidase [Candidatus Stygibacter australis]MDP8320996.1 M23 family metallopeptidase [Candidatus Stygibacter australis]
MNKTCCYLTIIILIIGIIFLIDYYKIKNELVTIKSELPNTASFSEQNPIDDGIIPVKDNTEDLKNILANYLKEQNGGNYQPDSITIENRFIPDLRPLSVKTVVSQKFSDKHPGIDLAAPRGTEVIASAAGKLEVFKQDEYFGNLIIIEHFNGYYTFYGHLDRIFAASGSFAEKGDVIGTVGSTGFSTGPHLHFSIQLNGQFIDPFRLLNTGNNEE